MNPVKQWQEQAVRWADRNPATAIEMDALYSGRYGLSRTDLNRVMLRLVPRTARVLEVGANRGVQLELLEGMGFIDLTAVDVSVDVLGRYRGAAANMMDLPFADGEFDLVMTSGCLMHVPPAEKPGAMKELTRVSSKWIYGWEIWSNDHEQYDWGKHSIPTGYAEDLLRTWPLHVPELRCVGRRVFMGDPPHCLYLMEK